MNIYTGKGVRLLAILISFVTPALAAISIWILITSPGTIAADPGGNVIYVSLKGTDKHNCGGKSVPCRTIQYAVDRAPSDAEVRIASGIYTDVYRHTPYTWYPGVAWITQVVYISKSITLRGGYSDINWSDWDPQSNITILNAEGRGRVLVIAGNITVSVESVRIMGGNSDNLGSSESGGGIYAVDARLILSGTEVLSNTAPIRGGAVFLWNSDSTSLQHNLFAYNSSSNFYGGGVYVLGSVRVTIAGNRFLQNKALYYGGGIYIDDSQAVIAHNAIQNNSAGVSGGGVAASDDSAVTLYNNILANNTAVKFGGGIYIKASRLQLVHNTLAHNIAERTGGIHVDTSENRVPSDVVMTNTILVGHNVGISVAATSKVSMDGTLWGQEEWANLIDTGGTGTILTGTHNFWGPTAFVNPDQDADYHLQLSSAAINNGVVSYLACDFDGNPRPASGAYDIGAYEVITPLIHIFLPAVTQ